MNYVVCIKQVPDTTEVKIDPETNNLVREGVPAIINPYDMHALEAALALKESYGGKVIVLSMGPPMTSESLKKAMGYGADEAILLSDRDFAGADTLATSYVLAKAIEEIDREEGVDLILCGKQAIDGDTGQVGPGIASRLDYSQLTYVSDIKELDRKAGKILVERKSKSGKEILEAKLPAVITVLRDINKVRYSALENLISASRYELVVWDHSKIGADPERIGIKGSPTVVRDIFAPPEKDRKSGEIIPGGMDNPEKAVKTLVDKLVPSKIIPN